MTLLRLLLLTTTAAACAPPETCDDRHDGGDGTCVAVGECVDGFTIEPTGRCSRWVRLPDVPYIGIRGTATLLRDGRVLFAGGQASVVEAVGSEVAAAALYLPAERRWVAAAPLATRRAFHLSMQLDDGRVIAAGGESADRAVTSTEMYDVDADAWSPGPPLPNGFVFGSMFRDRFGQPHILTATNELMLSNSSGVWGFGGAPEQPRVAGAVHVVGDVAVFIGGFRAGAVVGLADRFDMETFTWSPLTTSPLLERVQFTSGVLGDGRVVSVGGNDGVDDLGTVGLLDPATGEVEAGDDLAAPAQFAGAASLSDGVFLVVGGASLPATFHDDVQMILSDGSVTAIAPLPVTASLSQVIELPDGDVLVAQGGVASDDAGARETADAFLLERGD